MHIVIMGSSIFGFNLASMLVTEGHDVTIIENNESKCNEVAHKLDAVVILGDGTNRDTLEESNIDEADVFVAATENDETNLMACLLVKKFKVPKIISQVSQSDHRDAFQEIGINIMINPELYAAKYIERLIVRPNISDITVLGKGEAELIDIKLGNGKHVGKTVKEVNQNKKFNIIALFEDSEIVFPKQDTILQKGDKISILVKSHMATDVLASFNDDSVETEIFPGIKVDLYNPKKS